MSGAPYHVLIISEGPNSEDLDADVNWTLDGQCSPQCAVWYPCEQDDCRPSEDEVEYGEYTNHGDVHCMIEGQWMVLSTECGLQTCDAGADSLQDIAQAKGPGIWAVDTDYEGDGAWIALVGDRVSS